MIKIKKAQSWSVDIAIGIIVFMAAFFVLYALLGQNPAAKVSSLKEEASNIIKQLISGGYPLRIVDDNEINISKLNELKNLSYDELKIQLRAEGDFCIYFEDDKGNIVLINNSYKGIGSGSINLSGTPCSQK